MATMNGNQKNGVFEEIKIPVPWGHISGKWWGPQTIQPILAIHGWQDNAGTFDNLAPLLVERGHSLLCIDLPGHGLSSHYANGHYYYVFWDGIHLVRRIVKFFNWTNIVMIGHSLGGGIAFLYASTYPDDVKQYIQIDIASPGVQRAKTLETLGRAVDKFLEYETLTKDKQPCYQYDEMIDIVEKAYNGSVTKENCKILMVRGMRPADDKPDCYLFQRDIRLKVAALATMTIDQIVEFAARIQCEVLNIRGDPGYGFEIPYYNKVLDVIEKSARKLERHVVAGTHHLHLNQPESIIDIIHNFLIHNKI